MNQTEFRILVLGKSGSGKCALISRVFGVDLKTTSNQLPGNSDINAEFRLDTNPHFVLHLYQGFEPGATDSPEIVSSFLETRCKEPKLKDRLHAIWLCIEIPQLDTQIEDRSYEKFLRLDFGQVPIIVVFTKFDLLFMSMITDDDPRDGLSDASFKAYIEAQAAKAFASLCLNPLEEICGKPLPPHTKVSISKNYEGTILDLIQITQKHAPEDVRLSWAIAQRASAVLKISASIAIGKKRYWSGLASSAQVPGKSLEKCLNVIHTDIISAWNFYDPNLHLTNRTFKSMMSHIIDGLADLDSPNSNTVLTAGIKKVTGFTGVPSPATPIVSPITTVATLAKWVYNVYQETTVVLCRLMGYIVDLTIVMQSLFWLLQTREDSYLISRKLVKLAFNLYNLSTMKVEVHSAIHLFVRKSTVWARANIDRPLNEIIRLINLHQFNAMDILGHPELANLMVTEDEEQDWDTRTSIIYPGSPSTPPSQGIYQNLFMFLMEELSANKDNRIQMLRKTLQGFAMNKGNQIQKFRNILQEATNSMNALDPVSQLVRSHQYHDQLLRVASDLRISESPHIREALRKDEVGITNILKGILASDTHKKIILRLEGDNAQCMLNLIQDNLEKGLFSDLDDDEFTRARDAHRLLVRLSEATNLLPASLSITAITLLQTESISGGGFADIYLGSYQGEKVAVKRVRVFEKDDERHKIHRMICREALVWQCIKHSYVLPFLGIDSQTFPPHICFISPWMEHGTILKYMQQNDNSNVDQHIYEVAQGLQHLHAQAIVHGDLRGANILIDAERRACIADFGLTVLADGPTATYTSNSAGATRWMAPELLDPESFGFSRFLRTRASDVYAFACTCLEIYTGSPPFSDIYNDGPVVLKVMKGERPKPPAGSHEKSMPKDLWSIVTSSWSQQPSDRPAMSEVVKLIKTLVTSS